MSNSPANRTEILGVRLTPSELRGLIRAADGLDAAPSTLARRIILQWLRAEAARVATVEALSP